ncbi:Transcriptional regulator TetR family [Patulibacter medicamentivorans]|uniref:Transcriptional regulator TetR family n=1 Tax=Patulibacter medicamentivorans TaxID=1097667 RepID=H0E160_9ACTN|nr:TetR/AcrR family transcriptional regulator [Patulibacter medicamentivorans]EHN12580.1 Transcriptional regulator TetR family [Patulibacter medicamentivorans]
MPSITRRPSVGRERRDAVEEQVFAAVERLLNEGASYTELGVLRIAEEAGIARSTFYVHFRDKIDLLIRLAESASEVIFAEADRWVQSDEAGIIGLERTMALIVSQYREHAAALQALAEVAGYEPAADEYWRARIGGFAGALQVRLASEQGSGQVDAAIDAEAVAHAVAWAVERNITQHIRVDDGSGDERLAKSLAQVAWRVFYGRVEPA